MQAGDIYRAGRSYGLMPIMAEVYNLGTPDYYAVAVVKIRDDDSELIYLKRRKSCHTGGRDDDKKYKVAAVTMTAESGSRVPQLLFNWQLLPAS